MKTIHLMSGRPGAGKSSYLKENVPNDNSNIIIHRDDVRAKLREENNTTDYFPVSKKKEYSTWIAACAVAIDENPKAHHFWFDQTTLDNHVAAKFYNELAVALNAMGIDISDYMFCIEVLDIDLNTCLAQNAKREGIERIPENVIRSMFKSELPNKDLRNELYAPHPENTQYICIHNITKNETEMI